MEHKKLKRIIAFFIDYIIILWISFAIGFVIGFVISFLNIATLSESSNFLINGIIAPIAMIGLLFKDLIFKNQSFAKKLFYLKIKTIDDKNPSKLQLIGRNIFYIAWPIESIMLIIFGKKLGDIIFKTKVVIEK